MYLGRSSARKGAAGEGEDDDVDDDEDDEDCDESELIDMERKKRASRSDLDGADVDTLCSDERPPLVLALGNDDLWMSFT